MKNLFNYWDNLKKELNNKYIMLFLDYDGTLTPIVDTPNEAIIPKETSKLLKHLSKSLRCRIAIISGRALRDIKERIGLKNIIYVGNHGLEIEGLKIKFESPISPRCRAILEHIKSDLAKKLSSIKEVILEDKGLSLSLHYRLVDKKDIAQVKTILHEATILYVVRNKIEIKSGKMVFEVRLPMEWDKGKVVLWLLASQKFIKKSGKILPVYIGDDLTDEDAFRAIRNIGWTIYVGKPKKSYAEYYVKNTNEVSIFLKELLLLKGDLCQT